MVQKNKKEQEEAFNNSFTMEGIHLFKGCMEPVSSKDEYQK